MQTATEEILPLALDGVRLTFHQSELAKTEQFEEWMQHLVQEDGHPAYEVHDLVREACGLEFANDERSALLVALCVSDFAVILGLQAMSREAMPIWTARKKNYAPHLASPTGVEQEGAE